MNVFAFSCGWIRSSIGNFLAGERGGVRVPVPCFLIEHPRGWVLFDSGVHVATRTDARTRLGAAIADHYTVELAPGEDVGARLACLGVDPGRVAWLVQSHLHFDHCGGNAQVPNAVLVVQRREWEAGRDADLRAALSYDARDYDLGHDVRTVDGEHDLFGDGRIVCVPTYGHTPGHQSLCVRTGHGEIVLTADACYLRRTLDDFHLPPHPYDRDAMLASLRALGALRDGGARMVYGHDPELWAALPQAPAPLR